MRITFEFLYATANTLVTTADQSVAANSPRFAWSSANFTRTPFAYRNTTKSRYRVTILALIAIVSTTIASLSHIFALSDERVRKAAR